MLNGRVEEKNQEAQISQSNETHQKECTQIYERTAHNETKTKFKTKLTISEDVKEIYKKIKELNQKREKTNDKGKRINQILNRIKIFSLYDMQII